MTTDHPNPSKPRRRWFQYSLRTLLVLVTVLCVWLAVTVNKARKQREAVEAIEAVGRAVVYNWQVHGTPPKRSPNQQGAQSDIHPEFPSWIPIWIRSALGDDYFQKVVGVEIGANKDVGETWLEVLPKMPNLKSLRIAVPNFTDDRLARVVGLDGLESLYLLKPQITDSGLLQLKYCASLNDLQLNVTSVSPDSVEELKSLLPQCEIWYQPGDSTW